MTITLNLANGYKLSLNSSTVSYQSKLTEGPYPKPATWSAPVAVDYVLQRQITKQDVLEDPALLQGDDGRFHLWLIPLGSIRPKKGDKITDAAGVLWIVQSVELCDMDSSGQYQRRVCKCLKVVTTN